MRIRAFTRHGPLGASSRVRLYQFEKLLAASRCEIEGVPLLHDSYLTRRYETARVDVLEVVRGYAHRLLIDLRTHLDADLIWVEKELLPYVPAPVEIALLGRRRPLILDYDDAVFAMYEGTWLEDKISRLMSAADAVVVGNRYLADYASHYTNKVHIVPSVVDTTRYKPKPPVEPGDQVVTIGWIGTPVTQKLLDFVSEPLVVVARQAHIKLVLVGASPNTQFPGIETVVLPWSEEEEPTRVAEFDIGIMPVPDNQWNRGKCGYKLIQYMAAGLPVVASPVGANCDIVAEGKSGFLARTPDDWVQALLALVGAPAKRDQMGRVGRARVERDFSLDVAAENLFHVFRTTLESVSVPRRIRRSSRTKCAG